MKLNKKLSEMKNIYDFDGNELSVLDKNEEIYYTPEQKEKFKIQEEELKKEIEGKVLIEDLSMNYLEYINKMKYLLDEINKMNVNNKKVVFLDNFNSEVDDYDFEVNVALKNFNYKVKECKETIFVIRTLTFFFH